MKKYAAVLLTIMFIISSAFIAHAIHEVVKIPPNLASVGHYESMPEPAGGDLRHFFTGHQPYKKWDTWPGKSIMIKGTEPHGDFVTIYLNDKAAESVKTQKGMANNSVILQENYNRSKELSAVTVMYKVKGYNPEGGDWFWVKYDYRLKVISEGKVYDCIGCHSKAKNNDYVLIGTVTGK